MSLNLLAITTAFILIILYLIKYTYKLQIKEYRFDRLKAHVEDMGLLHFLYGFDIRTPSVRHARNIFILFVGCIFVSAVSSITPVTLLAGFILVALSPFIALGLSLFATFLTQIPVAWYRARYVEQARQKLRAIRPVSIGITGSYGKSTTKEYLHQILGYRYRVAKTERNQNTDVGVALSVLNNVTPQTEFFVAEMGAYKMGEITAITDFVQPKIGIITSIGSQHLSLFGGKEELFMAKSELARALPADGVLFVASNIAKIYKLRLRKIALCPVVEYEVVENDPHLTAIRAATAVAQQMGLSHEDVHNAVEHIQKPSHLKPRIHSKGYTLIDSSYNSSVEGFISHLHMLKNIRKQKKIVLTSGIIELGKDRESFYGRILEELPLHTTFYTSDKIFKRVADHLRIHSVVYMSNHYRLIHTIEHSLSPESALLIEGRFRPDFLERLL